MREQVVSILVIQGGGTTMQVRRRRAGAGSKLGSERISYTGWWDRCASP